MSYDETLPGARYWGRLSAFPISSLSELFVFIDEHEKTIDDGRFANLNPFNGSVANTDVWFDLPTDRHNQGCNLSFLDGHAEHWRWKAPKIFRGYGVSPAGVLDKADLHRLQECLPREK